MHRVEEFDADVSYLQTSTLCGEFGRAGVSAAPLHLKYPGCVKSYSLFTFTFNDFKRKNAQKDPLSKVANFGKIIGSDLW